jgi:hypothetical protein
MATHNNWQCLVVDPTKHRRTMSLWPVTAPTEEAAKALLKSMGMTVVSCIPLVKNKSPVPSVDPKSHPKPNAVPPAVISRPQSSFSNNAVLIGIGGCASVGLLIMVLYALTYHPDPLPAPQPSTTWIPPTAPTNTPPYAVIVDGIPSEVKKDGTVIPYGTLNQFDVPRTNWVKGYTKQDGTTVVPYLRGSPHATSSATSSSRSH